MDKCAKQHNIIKEGDSVSRRYAQVQGTAVFALDEKMLAVTKGPFRAPRKKYEDYPGSTASNTIGR
eukprot:8267670-Lingulodinium_polyedra.AAC.1